MVAASGCVAAAGGTLDYGCNCEWRSDSDIVVLEIQSEGSKSWKDSQPSTLKSLMAEMQDAGITDTTLCMHTMTPLAGLACSLLLFTLGLMWSSAVCSPCGR